MVGVVALRHGLDDPADREEKRPRFLLSRARPMDIHRLTSHMIRTTRFNLHRPPEIRPGTPHSESRNRARQPIDLALVLLLHCKYHPPLVRRGRTAEAAFAFASA